MKTSSLICSMPRSGGNMLLSLCKDAGASAGEYKHDHANGDDVALIHLHYASQIETKPERVVYLYRRNKIAQAVSWAVAMKTSEWKTGASTEPVHIESGEVVSLAGELQASDTGWLELFSQWSIPVLPVAYEDLVGSRRTRETAVGHLLGRAVSLPEGASTPRQSTWVSDVMVGRAAVDMRALLDALPDGLDARLRRSHMSRGYEDRNGKRLVR